MVAAIHFITGLPDSGSPLLAATLSQNPRFHVERDGPVAGFVGALLNGMNTPQEFSRPSADRQRPLHEVFERHYAACAADVPSTPTATGAAGCR